MYESIKPEKYLTMSELVKSSNIAEKLDEQYLDYLGKCVVDEYHIDKKSREPWELRNKDAIKLALQVVEKKTTPFIGASNVKIPILTTASLQFLSRISILTKGRKLVQCDVLGNDAEGKESARAKRISAHMSYQLIEEDINWIDDDETAKFAASILGTSFKKSYFDPVAGINISEFVPAYSFVVDYYTRRLDGKTRCTHVIPMSHNDLAERERMGLFLKDGDVSPPSKKSESNHLEEVKDKTQGIEEPADDPDRPYEILEQHRWMDLDGDEYKEPYIVFVRLDTGKVKRIVARYYDEDDVHRLFDKDVASLKRMRMNAIVSPLPNSDEQKKRLEEFDKEIEKIHNDPKNLVIRIDPITYFTKIPFLPSPDGGFYGLGWGSLIGPINAAADTALNQIIDSATLASRAGGILGRGVKLKGGDLAVDKWTPIDSPGDDIRKNVMRWPVSEPNPVLFQVVEFLVNYGQILVGATDVLSGVSPGQNTPAETSRNTIKQGLMIFSGIYQRMHRAFQEELRKLYRLNAVHMNDSEKFVDLSTGNGAIISRDDYVKEDVIVKPSADASSSSDEQRQQKAMFVSQRVGVPGYNIGVVEKQLLEAFDVDNISQIYPGPEAMPPQKNPKVQLEEIKQQGKDKELQFRMQQEAFDIEVKKFEMQQQVEMQQAQILKLMAEIVKLQAEAKGVDTGHQIAMIEAQIGAAKAHRQDLLKQIEVASKHQLELLKESKNGTKQEGMATEQGDAKVSE